MVLVDPGTFFGMLRYAILALLIILTVYLLHKSHDWRKTWPGMLSLVVTVIAAPFLIFDFVTPAKPTYTPEPEQQQEPVPDPIPEPEPEPEPEPTPIPEPEKEEEDEPTPANNVAPSVAPQPSKPSSKPSVKPAPAKPTEPDTPETPDTPEEPIKEKHEITISDATISSKDKSGKYSEGEEIEITANAKQGYTFDYWSSNDDTLNNRSENPLAFMMPDKAVTIKPVYKANTNTKYTVIHKLMNVTGDDYDEYETETLYGTTDAKVTPSTNTYEHFTAPTAQEITITGDGKAELVYKYTRDKYQLTLNNASDIATELTTGKYYYETQISVTAKDKTGYSFTGWSNGGTDKTKTFKLIAATTLGPTYTANSYKIKFDANGGSNSMSDLDMTYDEAKNLTANAFTRAGHSFSKWNTQADGNGDEYDNEESVINLTAENGATVTLYAQWSANTYAIEYNANGGEGSMASTECTYDVSCQLRTNGFTREGYNFTGWTYSETNYTDGQTVTNLVESGTIALQAQWTPIHYKITFDGNQADSGEMSEITLTYGESITLPASAFTRTGYAQNGWKNGETAIADKAQISNLSTTNNATITLVAQWTANSYKVRFNANGGTGSMNDQDFSYDEAAKALTVNAFTRDHHDFKGWALSASATDTDYDDEEAVQNLSATDGDIVTLYAIWEETPPVCKAAQELHYQTCEDGSCSKSEYSTNVSGGKIEDGVIYYGHIPTSKSPKAGDAYDCDVNNDGIYDSETERFYVLGKDGGNIKLIYGSGYDNGENHVTVDLYENAIPKLPTSEQWNNPNLMQFDDGKITNMPTVEDITGTCGISLTDINTKGSLKNCIYLLDNTAYSKKSNETHGPRSAYWAEEYNGTLYRVHSGSNNMNFINAASDSKNSTRPVIKVSLDYIEEVEPIMHTIMFDAQGGDPIDPIQVEEGEAIGELPVATGVDTSEFDSWSLTTDGSQKIDNNYIVTGDVTLYAIWDNTVVARANGRAYTTLKEAIENVPTNSQKTVVTLLKDTQEADIRTVAGQNIELDLRDNKITNPTSDKNVIVNKGVLTIKNGSIISTASSGAVNNEGTAAVLYVTGGTIQVSGSNSKQAIYNKGGTTYISGNPTLSSTNSGRATVHNLENGTMVITGGTITSTGQSGVYNESGSLTIGTKDGFADASAPIITGQKYGVSAAASYNFYDGILRGKTYSIATGNSSASDTTDSMIADIETDAEKIKETDGNYKVFYLRTSNKYQIKFDGNGGTASEASRAVTQGSAIGELPTANRAQYNFVGWFTEDEGGTEIGENTIPSGNTTYYAHWITKSQDEIVTFYMPSDAAKNYFTNISSWKGDETTLLTKLKAGYEGNSCKDTSPTDVSTHSEFAPYKYNSTANGINCDQPKVYDTGISDSLIVRESDESTKTKTGTVASYINATNGKIVNMVPGTTYYWESTADSTKYGYVKAAGERRFIQLSSTRNVRDLGGLTGADGKTIQYGRIIRGEAIKTAADKNTLIQLGIDKEYELRKDSDGPVQLDDREKAGFIHYNMIPTENYANFEEARDVVTRAMQDLIAGKNIYIHCTHGADRTGTLAYLLEGLLGVSQEDRYEDYELTTLAGQSDRTRYYRQKGTSNSGEFVYNRKFVYMTGFIATNSQIYNWYTYGMNDAEKAEADTLIAAFRAAVLE